MTGENSRAVDTEAAEPAEESRRAVSGGVGDPSTAAVAKAHVPPVPARLGLAGNALKHGLAARTVLPDALRLRTEELTAALRGELRPAGFLVQLLVDELGRHAAGMELAGHAEGAVLRSCALERSRLDALLDRGGPIDTDAGLTAAITNQPIDRVGLFRVRHEAAFYRALGRLREIQAMRHVSMARAAQFARFHDETACAAYPIERTQRRAADCPRCGGRDGSWLARGRWECSSCGLQVGLRWGSVMAGSRLPLRTWFRAIGELLANPAIRPEQLQLAIELPRLGTVRKLLRKILAALQSPHVDRLLAGLQRLAPCAVLPEFCDVVDCDLTKRP